MGFFKRSFLILWMCLFCISSSYAVPITSPEIEAAKERATQEVRDLTPVKAAIKHARGGEYRFFIFQTDFVHQDVRSGARCAVGALGISCGGACFAEQLGLEREEEALTQYNLAMLALPDSPYAKNCVPDDKDAYKKIQQAVIKKLGVTQENYDAARQRNIEKYRILDIVSDNGLAALKRYTGDLNIHDVMGRSALDYAVKANHLEMFEALLKRGIDTTSDKDFFARMSAWKDAYRDGHHCSVLHRVPFAQSFIEHAKDISTQDTAYYLAQAGGLKLLAASLKKYPQEETARVVQGVLESCMSPKDMLQVLAYLAKDLQEKEISVPMKTCWPFLKPLSYDTLDVLAYLAHRGVRVVPDKDGTRYTPGYCTGYEPAHLRNQALEMLGNLGFKGEESPLPAAEATIYPPDLQ